MSATDASAAHDAPDDLDAALDELAERLLLDPPHDEQGLAELVALLPCEPVTGPGAVAVWQSQGGAQMFELVRFDATRLDDAKALREALILLAMTEALETVLEPLGLRELIDLLIDWSEAARDRGEDEQADPGRTRAELEQAVWNAVQLLQQLEQAATPSGRGQQSRMASALLLDRMGGMLRQLEQAWSGLERAAQSWIQDAHERDAPLVQQLWTALATGRRGPLRTPVSAVVEQGRAAGATLADEVVDPQ